VGKKRRKERLMAWAIDVKVPIWQK